MTARNTERVYVAPSRFGLRSRAWIGVRFADESTVVAAKFGGLVMVLGTRRLPLEAREIPRRIWCGTKREVTPAAGRRTDGHPR